VSPFDPSVNGAIGFDIEAFEMRPVETTSYPSL